MGDLLFIHALYGEGNFVGWYNDKYIVRFTSKIKRVFALPMSEFTIYDIKKQRFIAYTTNSRNVETKLKAKIIKMKQNKNNSNLKKVNFG